jgi:hypothetical protein
MNVFNNLIHSPRGETTAIEGGNEEADPALFDGDMGVESLF